MNTENGWRVPAPNPDNASAWRTVLMHYLHNVHQPGVSTLTWICPVIDVCRGSRRISVDEAAALGAELDEFLQHGGARRHAFLTVAAHHQCAWPQDLSLVSGLDWPAGPGIEFRLRFLRWRAGLDPQGELPWAQMTGEPA